MTADDPSPTPSPGVSSRQLSSQERRARREARRRTRRRGKRLILAGYVVVALAVVVGAAGLLGNDDDGDDALTTDALESESRRNRRATTTTDETVVIDLVPSTVTTEGGGGGGGGGGQGAGVSKDTIVTGDTFGVRTVFGIVQVAAAPRVSRPRPNLAPVITAPSEVSRDESGDVVISGIHIDDPDYPGVGDIGVLLIIDGGSTTVTLNQEVQLLAPNSGAFVALAGPPEALNRALADLRVHADDPTDLLITVTDWAYGDLPRAGGGGATIALR